MADAPKFANAINPVIIVFDDWVLVIDVMAPPELHLMMGAVIIAVDWLILRFGWEYLEPWMKEHHVIRSPNLIMMMMMMMMMMMIEMMVVMVMKKQRNSI